MSKSSSPFLPPGEQLPEPYGSALAFLADLHEQIDLQTTATADPTIKMILQGLAVNCTSAATMIYLLRHTAGQKAPDR